MMITILWSGLPKSSTGVNNSNIMRMFATLCEDFEWAGMMCNSYKRFNSKISEATDLNDGCTNLNKEERN
jgi:hypothetical protein